MPLESATYIDGLVATNPTHTDGLSQADSHMRMLKAVLQATFPNLTGPVTATQAELNACVGLTGTVVATYAPLAGAAFTGPVTGTSITAATLNATTALQKGGLELLPSGVIIKWVGAANAVPSGWHLCDGTSGTPDLRDKFIVGAGNTYTPGVTGGFLNPTVNSSQTGAHTHSGATAASSALAMTGSADSQGAHSHGGQTAGYGLQAGDIPAHNHGFTSALVQGGANISGGSNITAVSNGNFFTDGGVGLFGNPHVHGISSDGTHSHNITVSNVPAHTHVISSDGLHFHTVTIDTRPPYFALCYIMRVT